MRSSCQAFVASTPSPAPACSLLPLAPPARTRTGMIRHRRRYATMAHAVPYLALAGVTVLSLSNWRSAPPGGGGSSEPSSYLYDAPDSSPVLDHGRSGSDFLRSNAPKVVEFYDPKCGACRAFAANYVEVAKKVRASKPAVEFYGVSCEVHAALCAGYGGSTVPKIFAFPDGEDNSPGGGTQVPKGAGTVHFLAGRLAKALRTPEEVAGDGKKLAESEGPEPKRRLLEEWSGGEGFADGDEGEGVAESDDPDDDADADEGDDDAASADKYEQSENTPSEDPDDEEEGVAEADEDGSYSQEVEDSASDKDERRSYAGQGRQQDFPHNKNHGRVDLERDESGDMAKQSPKRKSEEFQHEQTDAYRNTMKHFETIDIQKGKPVGYHYQKMKDDRKKEVQKKKGERGHPQRAPEEKTVNHYLAIKQEVEERERRQRLNAQRNEREGFDSTGETRGQTRDPRRPHEDEAISKRERAQRNDKEKRDEFDNKLRANQKMRERLGMGDQQRARQQGQHQGQNQDEQIDDSRGAAAQRREDPRQPKRPATDGTPRYAKSVFEQKDGDKQIDDSRGAAAQRREDPRRPAREDKPDTDGAPRYAKSVFEPKDQSPFPRKAHTGPVSLQDVNISQEREKRPAKRPAVGNNFQRQEQPRQVPPPPPREQLPVGGDASVPNPLETDPVRAQKFQEYVARRKQTLERKEKMKHPIKAILGDGTPKEGDTTTNMVHKKKSPMNNYKSQMNAKPNRPDLRPEAQRKTVGEKVMRKIPIVKRAFKRSKGEETLNDAALSFARGLLMGAFKTNAALDYKRKAALTDWLDLLRVSIPPEVGLHRLLDTLRYSIDSVSERRENLVAIVEKHPLPDREWSQSCKKGSRGGGFFCGFWKLLHVMSVGFAEQGGGLALRDSSPNIRVFSPKEAGDVVREYMAYFFNCDKCSKRFIAQYDDCSFQRCTRLTDETDIPAESWQEFPLWLWQVHNDISRSKINRATDFHDKEGRRAEAKKWEQDMNVVYPHIGQCLKCVTSSGTWDLNAVYHHLENEYWTFGHVVDAKVDQLLDHGIERSDVSFGLGTYAFVTVIMLIALYAKKHRLRVTGRHKKVEADAGPSQFGRTPKYRDS